MDTVNNDVKTTDHFFTEENIDIQLFDRICSQKTDRLNYPLAKAMNQNVLIYNGLNLRTIINNPIKRKQIKAELAYCLKDGPGIFVIENAYSNLKIIEQCTQLFFDIIAEEKAVGHGQGDHFGTNERIWNSFQKVCLKNPSLFIDYYGNPLLAIACEAWLGPFYQMTAQVNNVKPGGKAQSPHRDYHLGFQSSTTVSQFPAHAQKMSQFLTLQGAIAHEDMPLSSGPTLFLPFSQQFDAGYMAYQLPAFKDYFERHKVQIPFKKGDMVFFNPAVFHGAGTNTRNKDRLANLVQISSAFGRTMETIDTQTMVKKLYPVLQNRLRQKTIDKAILATIIAVVADGYSFPTNLDADPPIGGHAPETDQYLLTKALEQKWSLAELVNALEERTKRRIA